MQKDAALVFGHANGTVVTTLKAEGEAVERDRGF